MICWRCHSNSAKHPEVVHNRWVYRVCFEKYWSLMKVRNQPTLRRMKKYYYWTNIRKWNYFNTSFTEDFWAIVIRTRFDEGTESAEVATSAFQTSWHEKDGTWSELTWFETSVFKLGSRIAPLQNNLRQNKKEILK